MVIEPLEVIGLLQRQLAENDILTDKDALQRYGTDWTRVCEPDPLAVVFPRSTKQVQALVQLANEYGIGLVPSGGRTGLSGGAVAGNGELVVALDRMNEMSDFNAIDRTLVCEAGVVLDELQRFAREQGLFYPVDLAASGSCQIGGNVATNAGGIKVIRYGNTRNWVAGLKVVTGKGDILELNRGLVKNATGYDLRQLFVGSEGTLGFITEVTVRLIHPPKNLCVLVLGIPEFDALMNVSRAFRQAIELTAFEFFSQKALDHVLARGDVPAPFDTESPLYALLEFDRVSGEEGELVMALFEKCTERGWVLDGVMSQNETQLRNLWRLREDISESIAVHTPYKNDLSVTVSQVPAFLKEVDQVVQTNYPDLEVVWYGHIGDGNLHLNVLKPEAQDKDVFFTRCASINEQVFQVVARFGGSISAEHGVGLLKRDYLQFSRSEEEIDYMRLLKKVFDPAGIMNPGKMLG